MTRSLPARVVGRARREVAQWRRALGAALVRSPAGGLVASARSRQLVHCFGDSHVRVFERIEQQRLLPSVWFDVTAVRGATALGLAHPDSKTQALPKFERVIRHLPAERPLLFMLGEVDCGFIIWYRAQKYGESPQVQLDASIENYTTFVDGLRAAGRTRLIVAAAPPPTILDGQDWGEVASLRRAVQTSLRDRTEITTRYNERLRHWTRENGIAFLDYEDDVLDPATELVRDEYRHGNALNHHLHPWRFADLMARQVAGVLGVTVATTD
jgi:hypothetical protein